MALSRLSRRQARMGAEVRKGVAATVAAAVACLAIAPADIAVATNAFGSPPSRSDTDHGLTDPSLLVELETASASDRIVVEVLTDDPVGARTAATSLGGVVTGSVPGEVLQVSIAASKVDELIDIAGADEVRLGRIANRPVTQVGLQQAEFGSVIGENIGAIDADLWHDAGIRGGVRVGIVDFFDLTLWNPTEHGQLPPLERRFCRDTIQVGENAINSFCRPASGIAYAHGVAVAEVLKDVAPDAELWLATVAGASDLRAAIDWFAANGVMIITRSLGAAYDGPGDGTGVLGGVVDHATSLGITWFNSAGNDAGGSYGRYTDGVDAAGYVDFLPGPGVDTSMTIWPGSSGRVGFDGIRWSDWNLPPSLTTDYRVEITTPLGPWPVDDVAQKDGASPLEAVDLYVPGPITLRIRRVALGGDASPDVIEVGLFEGRLEYHQNAYSAAKPVVDSRSPALVAVGAIDPPNSSRIAWYSSQGPTNDGRTKPDVSAPSCVTSSIFNQIRFPGVGCFNGTSAASPSAAGVAALLFGRGLATSGAHLAALTKHLVVDFGALGPDNEFGAGMVLLPPPPPATIDNSPSQYVPLATPQRILDTRAATATPGARVGPHPQFTVIDVALPADLAGATAVAVGVVSTDSSAPGYVQAVPRLQGQLGASSTLNVATPGQVQPNFAVVPVGAGNAITMYLFAGGNVVVDLLGAFRPAPPGPVASGRFIAIDPVRVLDTRPESAGPVPAGWVPHRPAAGESVRIEAIPAGASAAVVNVVADQAVGAGFLRAQASDATGLTTSNGNYTPGVASGTLSIVPVGADGTISVFTSNSAHLVVDLMGYVTGPTSDAGTDGLLVPLSPARIYDSRESAGIHSGGSQRTIQVTGGLVPAGASAVSMNLTSDASTGAGYVTVYPADRSLPLISNLNYPPLVPQANAGMVRLSGGGALNTFVNQTTHVIIDVNGYFTGTT